MNRNQLIEAVAEKTSISKVQTVRTVKAVLDVISDELAKGEVVSLTGFGKFKVTARSARTGRHPRTGTPIRIAASRSLKLSPGTVLRKAVKAGANKKVARCK